MGMIRKYSTTLHGHRTSFSLEPAFHDELRVIAEARSMPVAALIREIDDARGADGNLSSALRLHVLDWLKRKNEPGRYKILTSMQNSTERKIQFDRADPIGSIFAPLIAQRCWLVRKGHGSFLTLEFGEPNLSVRAEPSSKHLKRPMVTVQGDWHLWIYICHWQIMETGAEIAVSESTDEAIAKGVRAIDGKMLIDLAVDPRTGASRFGFELETVLHTSPIDAESEIWMLYAPDGNVLTARGDGHYTWHAGTENPEDAIWLAIPDTTNLQIG